MKLRTFVYLFLITFVASLFPAANAQTFSVIHAFDGMNAVGPTVGVTLKAGVLYGITHCLQSCNDTVYKISRVGSNWAYTPISTLSAGGFDSQARVVFGPDNLLYGTTVLGGAQGMGVVFSLTPQSSICRTANCFYTEKVLHQFAGNPDGWAASGDLAWDAMGNIYGTTYWGGISDGGTVYQLTKSGNAWTESVIHQFSGSDGYNPEGGVIVDSNGKLFGTTYQGGANFQGSVFEMSYVNGVGWTENVIYSFQNQGDGRLPHAGLVRDSHGSLYGATSDGGAGDGSIFELSPVGNTWVFTVLYSFPGPASGCGPFRSLTLDASGNLYGTTLCDGANFYGNVFKLANTQNGWVYTSLHDFTWGEDGWHPTSEVTVDADGTLYGTASGGGSFDGPCSNEGCGTVWMIKP